MYLFARSKSFENMYPRAIEPAPDRVCIGTTRVIYPWEFGVFEVDQSLTATSRSKDSGEYEKILSERAYATCWIRVWAVR
jgi:hypothetical protein